MRLFRKSSPVEPPPEIPAQYTKLIKSIQGALSLDLRHRSYKPDEFDYESATAAHCYIASEAAYHLFARDAGYLPYVCKNENGTTHWWLQQQETGDILDPTLPQHEGKRYPYEEGRRQAFLTKQPSRRAAELMRRVRAAQAGWKEEAAGESEPKA